MVYADCPICGDRRGKMGLYTALSDVIELYGDEGRSYFYCDVDGFPGVRFSPMLATWLGTGT